MASDLALGSMRTLLKQLVLLDSSDTTTLLFTGASGTYSFNEVDLLNEAYRLVWAQSRRRAKAKTATEAFSGEVAADTAWFSTLQGEFYTRILSMKIGESVVGGTSMERSSFGEQVERRAMDSASSAVEPRWWWAARSQRTGDTNYGRWVFWVYPQHDDAVLYSLLVEIEATEVTDDSSIMDLDPWEIRIVIRLAAAEAARLLGRAHLIEGILAQVPERFLISAEHAARERLPGDPEQGFGGID